MCTAPNVIGDVGTNANESCSMIVNVCKGSRGCP